MDQTSLDRAQHSLSVGVAELGYTYLDPKLNQPRGPHSFFGAHSHVQALKWTPLSRPFLALNKLMFDGVLVLALGRPRQQPPFRFRRWNRRSGRIPAEPYPPFQFPQCRTSILARKR
jgi:hypothetical protein